MCLGQCVRRTDSSRSRAVAAVGFVNAPHKKLQAIHRVAVADTTVHPYCLSATATSICPLAAL